MVDSFAIVALYASPMADFTSSMVSSLYAVLNVSRNPENDPSKFPFCPSEVGGIIVRFGAVKRPLVSSSVWRVTHSMIKSGKLAMRLFLSLTILVLLSGFAVSISTPTSSHGFCVPPPMRKSGPPSTLRVPLRERRSYRDVSSPVCGFLR